MDEDIIAIMLVTIGIILAVGIFMGIPALIEENNSNRQIVQCIEAGGEPVECREAIR